MSKMIIYFCLFIPLLFLPSDSSSIRGRIHKNDLVPFLSSRMDTIKKDPNSMKIVSKDPFIIQLQMPNSKDVEAKGVKEKDKKRKQPVKKRVSKIKSLRKKHRKRRDLFTSKTKPREEKFFRFEIPSTANDTKVQLQNITTNSVNRVDILKALSSYPKKTETRRRLEGIRNVKEEDKINTGKTKKNNASNRSHHKRLSLSDRSKIAYPNTPKIHSQKYTYKDLMADRERLEQKIKYIKNMLSVNDSTTDDPVRVRRRSDSDRTANKIAKMFLTLSAVNGLHDRKKSKCNDEDYDDDRVEDIWEKERRNNPYRRSSSSNEERYKVKKWIEFMKNKRSSGKTCPCMSNVHSDEGDAFPLEQKLPKGYFLMERGRSSEESSELYRDPLYYSRDKINRNDNVKKRLSKTQEQDNKNKALGKNGKRKMEVPFEDLELYRSRARQILQNAEEILDKIKEEEEKRLAAPNILMSQLKELTARIHGDPRNNENDLIRKIQKNLGWGPLATPQDNADGTFLDNVKSFILDPYEKAKALTDESTKKLSSYLLRNLGRLEESSEEQEIGSGGDKTDDETLKVYFGELPHAEEKPVPASLAKEDDPSKDNGNLRNWEDTLTTILKGGGDAINKENDWNVNREEPTQQELEEMIREKQEKLDDYKKQSSKEIGVVPMENGFVAESKPESLSKEERVAMKINEKEMEENNQEKQSSTETGVPVKESAKSFPLRKGFIAERKPESISDEEKVEMKLSGKEKNESKQEKQEKLDAHKEQSSEAETSENKNSKESHQLGKGFVGESKPESTSEEERVAMTLNEKETDENKQGKSKKFGVHKKQSSNESEITDDKESTEGFPSRKGFVAGSKPESVLEEERVAMTLNEKEMEENNQEKQTKLKDFEKQSSTEIGISDVKESTESLPSGKGFVAESKPESVSDEERVEMTLNEKEKVGNDQKQQSSTEYGITDDKKSTEELPLEKGFLAERKPESVMEEERVAMKLNEKEADENNKLATESQSTNEKDEIKNVEDPDAASEKVAKESDIVKNQQPFRETEGTFQGKEGESKGTPSRDMQEEEELEEEIGEIIKAVAGNKDSVEDEESVQKAKMEENEEKAPEEDIVSEVFDKQEEETENEKVGETASPGEEAEGKSDDPRSDERVGKKSDKSSSISLTEEASSKDSEIDRPTETEQNSKEIIRADLKEDGFESNEEPVLEKQRELDSKKGEGRSELEENKSENTEDADPQTESPYVSELLKDSKTVDALSEEIIQKQNEAKTLPEHADLVKEAKQSSKEFSELKPKEIDQSFEILKTEREPEKELDDEDDTRKENADDETLKAVLDKENNSENMNERTESDSREGSNEDINTPLRATLENQENSKEPGYTHKSFSKESDDYALLTETNSEDEKNETGEDIDDETVKETLEDKSREILGKEKSLEGTSSSEKSTEDVDDQQRVKSTESGNGEAILNESNPIEEVVKNAEDDETPLKAVMSGQYVENAQEKNASEVNEKDENLDKEGSDETNLKSSLDESKDLEKDDEINLKAKGPNYSEGEDNMQNSNEDQETLNSDKSTEDVGSQKETQEGSETLGGVLDTQKNLGERDEEAITSTENKQKEIIDEKDDESIVKAKTPDEVKETSQELLKALSKEEIKEKKEKNSEETLREANPDGNVEDEKSSMETLKAIQDNKQQESVQTEDDEEEQDNLRLNEPEDENVEAVIENNTQEKLEEQPEETLKAVKLGEESNRSQEETNLKSTLENKDELKGDATLKEANIEESEEEMKEDDDGVRAVFHSQERTEETLDEDEGTENEEVPDDEKMLLKVKSFEEEVNNQNSNDEILKAVSAEQDQEYSEESYENLQSENPEKDQEKEEGDYETPLRSASFEDEFDNKIEYETPLKSAHPLEDTAGVKYINNLDESYNMETLRAENVPQNINNQIDDDAVLKSTYLGPESTDGLGETTYDGTTGENLEAVSLPKAKDSENWQENLKAGHFPILGDLKKHDAVAKSLKPSTWKVPESIGKIMKDLDGKDKTDITSMQNLNPTKIDHMLDKIGQAEQQNRLDSEEVDCRKECACAEEMNTRSRNIGRYEIVKDFLQWVKDLQMNRVLSDD